MEILVKYTNRKLRSTKTKSYVSLKEIIERIKDKTEFKVINHRTKEDCTNEVLKSALQIKEFSLVELQAIIRSVGN